jgi:hypothetical protein
MPRQPSTVITSPRKQSWAEDGSRLDLAPRMVCLQPARVTRPLPAAGRNPTRPLSPPPRSGRSINQSEIFSQSSALISSQSSALISSRLRPSPRAVDLAAVDFRVGPVSWPPRLRDVAAEVHELETRRGTAGRKRKRAEPPAGPAPKRWRVAAAADLAPSEPEPVSPPPARCEMRPEGVEPPPVVSAAEAAASTAEVKIGVGEMEAEKENAKVEEVDDRAPITGGGRKQSPSRDRRSCHQCKRVKPRPEEMIRCQRCDLRIYCAACVRNRQCIPSISPCSVLSIILFFFLLFLRSRKGNCRCYRATLRFCRYPALSEAEEREACPFCRGVCICTLCDKQAKSKVRILYPSMELR